MPIRQYKRLPKGGPPLARTHRRPQKHFRLLDLPREIRDGVLQELLFSSEPLKYRDAENVVMTYYQLDRMDKSRNYALYTEILRTCKQLHEEGSPILQSNTVGLDVWCAHGSVFTSCMGNKPYMGYSWIRGFSSSYDKICQTAESIQVCIHLRPEELMSADDSFGIRDCVSRVCEELIDRKEMGRCRVDIEWTTGPPPRYTTDNDIGEKVLDCCTMLRPREAAVTGFSAEYAVKIERAMLSAEPGTNIFAMRDALAKYMKPTQGDFFLEADDWIEIDEAVYACDYSAFKKTRDAMVGPIEEERERLKRELYEHDLGGKVVKQTG